MPSRRRKIYWDSNCWLSLINAVPERVHVLESLLSDSKNELGDIELVTSVISKVEVAFVQSEYQGGQPDRTVENAIDALWADTAVTLIETHDQIALEARGLVRSGLHQAWSLKPLDAIHLATAKWFDVEEFHTYDKGLIKEGLSTHLGFPIENPSVTGLSLPPQLGLPIDPNDEELQRF